MLHWIWVFIIGLLIGLVAKALMPGKDPGGFIITGLLGIAGMFLGDWLAGLIGVSANGGIGGFIIGVIGAVVLLFLYRMVAKPKT